MKRLISMCAWLAAVAVTASCTGDGIGPATQPLDPFGTDPARITGSEPTGGGSESLSELCARACANIQAGCPEEQEPACAAECVSSSPPGCEREFRAFVECIASTPLTCDPTNVCSQTFAAVNSCVVSMGSSGGTGSGGASGTSGGAAGASGTR